MRENEGKKILEERGSFWDNLVLKFISSSVLDFFSHHSQYHTLLRLPVRTENGMLGKKKMPKVQEIKWVKDIEYNCHQISGPRTSCLLLVF